MIYRVTIDGQTYKVEITDIHARPVIALVNGIPVEVAPEEDGDRVAPPNQSAPLTRENPAAAANPTPVIQSAGQAATIVAPIPGTVVSVSVHAGDKVKAGQEVCAIEAMKMKNAIRSGRDGVVSAVKVVTGQPVQHRQVLVEFAE
jgi:biotin carboxyl carrier protein